MKRNRILYFSLLFLSFVFVYFYGGRIPYMLFHTVIVLPIVSITLTAIAFFRFKYTQDINKRSIVKGEEVEYSFSIHNEDLFLYPYIKVNFQGNETVFFKQFHAKNFSLLPFRKKTFTFKLNGKYRGEYAVGIKSFEFEDFLGLVKLTYNPMESKIVKVTPRIVNLDNLNIMTDYSSESHSAQNNRSEDTSTISDVRKYAYGDSLKKIHWKLSAKMNELLVKNFESTSNANSVLILDLKRGGNNPERNAIVEDKLIECAVAVVYYCLRNWIPVNLVYYKDGFIDMEAKNAFQFDGIYEVLSKVSFDQTIELKDILKIYVMNNMKKTDIMLFTSNLNYELYDEIYKTKLSGYDINLIYVPLESEGDLSNLETENILRDLPEIGVSAYVIDAHEEIKKVLENHSFNAMN